MRARDFYIVQHGHQMSGRWFQFKMEDIFGCMFYVVAHGHQMSVRSVAPLQDGGHMLSRALYCSAWPPDVR
jgi:hypothetical protein